MSKERKEPTLTRQTMAVLSALIQSQNALPGSDLASTTKLASGTLYPILIRLEEAKWIESDWEAADTTPRRRLYRVTGLGAKRSQEEARAWKPFVERLA